MKKEQLSTEEKQTIPKKINFLLKKLRLRHMAFILMALAGISLTIFIMIILWRITSFGENNNNYFENQFIGIIGVLVAFVAAFMGVTATIMFANVVYNNIETNRRFKEIDRYKNQISDLYILTLNTEANEVEKEGHLLKAIERHIGVVHHFLKRDKTLNPNAVRYLNKIENNIDSLNANIIIEYYKRTRNSSMLQISEFVTQAKQDIDSRIINTLRSENAIFVETDLTKIKTAFDNKMDSIISEIKGKVQSE